MITYKCTFAQYLFLLNRVWTHHNVTICTLALKVFKIWWWCLLFFLMTNKKTGSIIYVKVFFRFHVGNNLFRLTTVVNSEAIIHHSGLVIESSVVMLESQKPDDRFPTQQQTSRSIKASHDSLWTLGLSNISTLYIYKSLFSSWDIYHLVVRILISMLSSKPSNLRLIESQVLKKLEEKTQTLNVTLTWKNTSSIYHSKGEAGLVDLDTMHTILNSTYYSQTNLWTKYI